MKKNNFLHNMLINILYCPISLILILLLTGCNVNINLNSLSSNSVDEPQKDASFFADYSDTDNWAYFSVGEDKAADVFLIAPTIDTKDEYNMSFDDPDNLMKFTGALNMQRGLYEKNARMYAPYYRQASLKVYGLSPIEREPYLQKAYEDISDAFSYYLENENKNRPIILAGFSQGADMCYRLLEEYCQDEDLCKRLVAVYA
ncbi:MAG: DUF3089 domain-containing protein, partial [Lachnospiraceae bacterium]|nr:DUF3089 domain-containing protein [Lachnospiraceae bacterium]